MKHAKKKNTKKRVAVVAAVIALAALVAVGSLAYFNADKKADNVITTKGITISLNEYQDDGTGKLVPYPEGPIGGVMPGDSISKIPVAEADVQSAPSWIRMRTATTVTSFEGEPLDPGYVALDFNEAEWTYNSADGWWYYNNALDAGARTIPLFTTMTLDKDTPNEYKRCKINVHIDLQAVQVANNGASAMDAAGWPTV